MRFETKTFPNGKTVHESLKSYEGLEDKKGRTPGHRFVIFGWESIPAEYRAYTHATRNGEDFGGSSTEVKVFYTLDEAKAYLERRAPGLEAATRKNTKQFKGG